MATTQAAPPARRLTELVLDFLAYLELERGLSRNTLEAYRSDLQQFGEFLARHQLDPLAVAPRDLALLETIYACGLRASEAIALELSQLDLEAGIVRPYGKGRKERIVPIGSKAIAALDAYLSRARPRLVGLRDERCVFLNLRG